MNTRITLSATALLVLGLAACAPADEETSATPATSGTAACAPADLDTVTPDTFTIATGKPAYSPWYVDDDPASGKGFESAVAYAVAEQLGYAKDAVTWTAADFNAAIAPGPKEYDVNIQQVSITDERKQAVDFSTGYYDVAQAVVTLRTSKAASAKTIADLAQLKLGAAVGTTSYDAIVEQIKPAAAAGPFDDNDRAKLALANGQVDALVVDLPTALYLAAAELDGGLVLGQLPAGGEGSATADAEQFGLVLEKGSPLTTCVSGAVDALREDGTLAELEKTWLTDTAGAPVLQ